MRISREKSYWRATPGSGAGSVLTTPASTPLSSASISSWLSTSWPLIAHLLHHERGEIQGFDFLGVAAVFPDDAAHALEAALAQLLLALERRDRLVALVGEDHQQVVAHARVVFLDDGFDGGIARHHADRDLEEAHDGFGFEIHDERRV